MLPLNQYRANYEYQQDSLTFASSQKLLKIIFLCYSNIPNILNILTTHPRLLRWYKKEKKTTNKVEANAILKHKPETQWTSTIALSLSAEGNLRSTTNYRISAEFGPLWVPKSSAQPNTGIHSWRKCSGLHSIYFVSLRCTSFKACIEVLASVTKHFPSQSGVL